jgi:hypothetical protein
LLADFALVADAFVADGFGLPASNTPAFMSP